jgi:hypothetical protein
MYTNAQQAKTRHSLKNIKEKLLKTNADIWFNKICGNHQLTRKYVNIKVNGNNKRGPKVLRVVAGHKTPI